MPSFDVGSLETVWRISPHFLSWSVTLLETWNYTIKVSLTVNWPCEVELFRCWWNSWRREWLVLFRDKSLKKLWIIFWSKNRRLQRKRIKESPRERKTITALVISVVTSGTKSLFPICANMTSALVLPKYWSWPISVVQKMAQNCIVIWQLYKAGFSALTYS